MELQILDTKGKDTGKKVEVSDAVFGIEPNDHAIYLDVKQYLAAQRQGTHKAKERGEITGSTRKLKKQKGTGTARAGSIKSPIFRGGGRIFGPRPRDYSFKLNKKQKQLARKSALSYKVKEGAFTVLNAVELKAPKTKDFVSILSNLKVADKKSLIVLTEGNENVLLSSRNLKNTKVVMAEVLNTYDIVHADNVFAVEGAIKIIEEKFN